MRSPCKCPEGTYGREHECDVLLDQILVCDNSIFRKQLALLIDGIFEHVPAAFRDFLNP